MSDDGREVGWTVELDIVQGVVVGCKDAINALAVWLAGVQGQEKLVRDLKC